MMDSYNKFLGQLYFRYSVSSIVDYTSGVQWVETFLFPDQVWSCFLAEIRTSFGLLYCLFEHLLDNHHCATTDEGISSVPSHR